MFRRALLCAAMATVSACGGGGGDDPALVPDTTSSLPPTTTAAPALDTEVIELTATEQIPAGAPTLVLATDDGVVRWRPDTEPEVVVDVPVRRAVDDGDGGIVGLTIDEQLLASLRWWPADGDEVLLRAQGGLTLHDATVRNGSPAVVIAYSPIDSDQPTQVLDVLDLATTSSRTVRVVGDETTGMVDAAAWTEGFTMTQVEDDCARAVAFDDAGEDTAVRALPGPVCAAGAAGYGPLGMADDGTTVAVTALTESGDPSVVVTVAGSDEVIEHPLGAWTGDVADLDASPQFVAVATDSSSLLIDLDEATVLDLGVPAHGVQLPRA